MRKDKVRIEPNTREFLAEIDKHLSEEYESIKMEMEVNREVEVKGNKKGKGSKNKKRDKKVLVKETKDVAIVKNTKGFLDRVVSERGLNPDTAVMRVVPDGGGGSFKVMVSIFDGNFDPEVTWEEQGDLNTGVNRLLPLAVVKNCPEQHHNLRQILNYIKLREVKSLFIVRDLKIYNVMLSLSAHGGKYSCSFCLGPAGIYSRVHRIFGHQKDHIIIYQKVGSNLKLMLQHYNTLND